MSLANLTMSDILQQQQFVRREGAEELHVPVVDLQGFLAGDPDATSEAARLVVEACERYGALQVVNHGVEDRILEQVLGCQETFFQMPLEEKIRGERKVGELFGYASSFVGRFAGPLWKETFSLRYRSSLTSPSATGRGQSQDYLASLMGEDFRHHGVVYEEYCEAMCHVSRAIMELLGLGLGVGRETLRDFFEPHDSIFRLNYYPECPDPGRNLGVAPHTDPISLAILHQDEIGGLEVLQDDKWLPVTPIPNALVISVGDVLMALCNGRLKSCVHRSLVNGEKARKSMVFFLSPEEDKVVSPLREMVDEEHPRKYQDFEWSKLLQFVQKIYKADTKTMEAFFQWLLQDQTTKHP